MQKKPEIIVFAGPNGSWKSTITKLAKIIEPYINADDIKKANLCSDLEAAQKATELREKFVNEKKSFTFETVLSTTRNLDLLKNAKENGFLFDVYMFLLQVLKSMCIESIQGLPLEVILFPMKRFEAVIQKCSRQTILTTTSQEENANISQEEKATIIIKQKFLEYVLNQ